LLWTLKRLIIKLKKQCETFPKVSEKVPEKFDDLKVIKSWEDFFWKFFGR
jgi:DNA/RNA-binding domain of Phe-tRNA-synthetase-like protein